MPCVTIDDIGDDEKCDLGDRRCWIMPYPSSRIVSRDAMDMLLNGENLNDEIMDAYLSALQNKVEGFLNLYPTVLFCQSTLNTSFLLFPGHLQMDIRKIYSCVIILRITGSWFA